MTVMQLDRWISGKQTILVVDSLLEANEANYLINKEIMGGKNSKDKKKRDYLGVNSYFSMVNTIFKPKTSKKEEEEAKAQGKVKRKLSIQLNDEDLVMMDVLRNKLGNNLNLRSDQTKNNRMKSRESTLVLVKGFKELRSHYPKIGNIEPQADKVFGALLKQLKAENENPEMMNFQHLTTNTQVGTKVDWFGAFDKYQKKIMDLEDQISKYIMTKQEILTTKQREESFLVDSKINKVDCDHIAPFEDISAHKRFI